MKRYKDLFDKICSMDNLILADKKARKGKKARYGINLFDKHREENLNKLHNDLINGTFKTSEYSVFTIYEPKERLIFRLPYYPDRIVHHAIMNVLEPIWLSVFTSDTYSCIKNRGIHLCARKLKYALKKDKDNTYYCLKMDIRKYYPSIDHDIMKEIILKKIKDKRLINLLNGIVDSAPGLPIGNYLSQYLSNLYLTYYDHYLKEVMKVKYYFRYADDMVILSSSKEQLREYLNEINKYMKKLKLRIKDNYQIFPVDSRGIDFLGYVFYHDHILLRKSIKKRMFKVMLHETDEEMRNKRFAAWKGWMEHCDSKNLCKTLKFKLNESYRNN